MYCHWLLYVMGDTSKTGLPISLPCRWWCDGVCWKAVCQSSAGGLGTHSRQDLVCQFPVKHMLGVGRGVGGYRH